MKVTEKEYYELLRLQHSMMLFASKKKGIVDKQVSLKEFIEGRNFNKFEARQAIYEIPNFHDNYLKTNPDDFDEKELEIIKGFKDFVKGQFYIIKYLKEYSIFMKDGVAYGVLAQNDLFQNMTGSRLVMVEAILLPYRGKIVYDGMLQSYNISFGSGMSSSLNDAYNEAKAKYGIVTTLPFDKKPVHTKLNDEEQLLFFMKDKNNREFYEKDIAKLVAANPKLLSRYHQEWGKIHSTKLKKSYKDLGLHKAYFAVLQGIIITSAINNEDLITQVKSLVPREKWDWVYVFKT